MEEKLYPITFKRKSFHLFKNTREEEKNLVAVYAIIYEKSQASGNSRFQFCDFLLL